MIRPTARQSLQIGFPALAVLIAGCGSSSKGTSRATTPAATSPATSTGASAGGVRSVAGSVVNDRFGENRVVILVKGKRITDVRYSLPEDRPRSLEINQQAGPLLRSEVLTVQSARIHVVSGATYTSEAFAQSLQAAISSAHLR